MVVNFLTMKHVIRINLFVTGVNSAFEFGLQISLKLGFGECLQSPEALDIPFSCCWRKPSLPIHQSGDGFWAYLKGSLSLLTHEMRSPAWVLFRCQWHSNKENKNQLLGWCLHSLINKTKFRNPSLSFSIQLTKMIKDLSPLPLPPLCPPQSVKENALKKLCPSNLGCPLWALWLMEVVLLCHRANLVEQQMPTTGERSHSPSLFWGSPVCWGPRKSTGSGSSSVYSSWLHWPLTLYALFTDILSLVLMTTLSLSLPLWQQETGLECLNIFPKSSQLACG